MLRFDSFVFSLFILVVLFSSVRAEEKETENIKREGKVFSLFSVVQFKNSVCAPSSNTNTYTNGTCFTSSECTSKGGTAIGNCASGFGVCCVFVASNTTSISQNNTYLQNPSYPAVYGSNADITYTINKVSSAVCSLRLDFQTFSILGPADTTETTGCQDMLTVTTAQKNTFPIVCGTNTGQHIYVDIGADPSDYAKLEFKFSPNARITATSRVWLINVAQIPCASVTSPPNGCLQYFYTATGRIKTFNFDGANGHLNSQTYSICIRPEVGYCCNQYKVCSDSAIAIAYPYSLSSGDSDQVMSFIDANCNTIDYIQIEGSSSVPTSIGTNLYSRYCGAAFTTDFTSPTLQDNVPIYDCTLPFEVGIYTNAYSDLTTPPTLAMPTPTVVPNTRLSRGVCLDFAQVPC